VLTARGRELFSRADFAVHPVPAVYPNGTRIEKRLLRRFVDDLPGSRFPGRSARYSRSFGASSFVPSRAPSGRTVLTSRVHRGISAVVLADRGAQPDGQVPLIRSWQPAIASAANPG
jgi:hypothetical protein